MGSLSEGDRARLLQFARGITPEYSGEIYAVRFEVALQELVQQGDLASFRATERNSEEDRQGIDYYVETGDLTIPFQVTSRLESGGKEARKRQKLRENHIPNINVLSKKKRMKEPIPLMRDIRQAIAFYRMGIQEKAHQEEV